MKFIALLKQALSFLFPPRKDERVVDALQTSSFCALLYPENKNGVITLLPYSHNDVRSVLWETKYHNNDTAISLLAHVLADYLSNETEEWVLVPIPLAPKRLRQRGYNQCERVAHATLSILGKGQVIRALKKTRETPTQTSLARSNRLKNVHGTFDVVGPENLIGKKIFVLDDVTTTGATLNEARRAFSEHSLTVNCIALARAG